MKTVGQILKDAREKKDVSLEEAEAATKIRKKILSRLEESDWSNLPSTTYVKGLLKNYGSFLELDIKALLAFYRREYEEPKISKTHLSYKIEKPALRLTPQFITVAVLLLGFLAAGFYLFYQYHSFTAAPLLEVNQPADNTKVETLDVNVVGKTYPDATLKINGQQVQLSPGGTFSVAVSLAPGINTIDITAENRFGKISTAQRTVVAETKSAAVVTQPGKENVNLTVRIGPGSANIRVELDGKETFEGVLVPGSTKIFSARGRVKILTSNAGSTKVSVNNGQEQVLGKEGETIEREFKKP